MIRKDYASLKSRENVRYSIIALIKLMRAKYMKFLVLNSEKIIFPTVKLISSSYSS